MQRRPSLLAVCLLGCLFLSSACAADQELAVPRYSIDVVERYPHDPKAFTQGLLYADGFLYESTGQRGKSTLRRVDPQSGKVLAKRNLESRYFAEGLALVENRLIQLTWQSGKGFVYERDTLKLVEEFSYPGEGWGLTYDGKHLIMSDGTARLRLLNPSNFEQFDHIDVTYQGEPLKHLNELEMVNGEIWANIWRYDLIVRINPETGNVVGAIQAGNLRKQISGPYKLDVLNGIAYDRKDKRLFVTGKHWPTLFSIKLREIASQ